MISSHALEVTIGDLTLHPIDASITLDETWAPFAQATLRCPARDRAQIAAIDPRGGVRGLLKVTQTTGRQDTIADLSRRWRDDTLHAIGRRNGLDIASYSSNMYWDWNNIGQLWEPPYVRTLDLALRSRDIDPATGEVLLTFASDEAIIQDNAHINVFPIFPPHPSLLQVVHWTLQREGMTLSGWDDEAVTALVDIEKNPLQPGQSAWDYIAPIVARAGLLLWCDEKRRWSIRKAFPDTGYSAVLSTTQNVTQARDRIALDQNYYRSVVVTYRWTDADGKQQTAYDAAFMPPRGRHVYTRTYERPYPGPGVATRILRSLLARAHEVPVTAVSDYRVEPGAQATIQITSTPPLSGRVSAVTWRFPADEMDVTTRELEPDQGEPETEFTPVTEEAA